MLDFIKKYILFLIPCIMIGLFFTDKIINTTVKTTGLDVIEKTKNVVIKPHIYSSTKDGKRIEIVAEKGENNGQTIVVNDVECKIYDAEGKCIAVIKTPSGEFNINQKILEIKNKITILFYNGLNKTLLLKGSKIVFDVSKRIIKSDSDIVIENDEYLLSAKSLSVDINAMNMVFNKPIIKKIL